MQVVYPHPLVLVLRDQDTVAELSKRLQSARRVVIVGNGGIATELAYSLQGVEVGPSPECRHLSLSTQEGPPFSLPSPTLI